MQDLLADYHIHTARCGHAVGSMDEYIVRAKAKGLTEIGFADHLPLFHTIDAGLTMSWDELPLYLADVKSARQQEDGLKIRLGIEADFIPKYAAQAGAIIEEYDFDYVLGSVHFVDGWGIDDRRYIEHYEGYRLEDLYRRYFDLFSQAAASGLFDAMAHPDLIKKYFRLPEEPLDLYEQAAAAAAEGGVALELSSAGWRKPCREPYPSRAFLEICRRYNLPIVLGSDAHAPDQVGYEFGQLFLMLQQAGYSQIALFEQRERRMVDIEVS